MRTRVERYAAPRIQRVHFHAVRNASVAARRFAPTPQTIAYLHEAQGAVAESSEAQQTPSIIFRLGFLLLWHDMLAEAEAKVLAALASAERSIDLTLEVRCLIYLGVVYRRQNRPDDVRACAARALELAVAANMPEYVATARADLAWLAWHAGDLAAVDLHGRAALALWAELAPRPRHLPTSGPRLWPLLAADGPAAVDQALAWARNMLLPAQQRLPARWPIHWRARCGSDAADLPTARQWLRQALDAAVAKHYL